MKKAIPVYGVAVAAPYIDDVVNNVDARDRRLAMIRAARHNALRETEKSAFHRGAKLDSEGVLDSYETFLAMRHELRRGANSVFNNLEQSIEYEVGLEIARVCLEEVGYPAPRKA